MKNIGRIIIRLGIAVVTSALLCSSLSAMTTIDFQVVDLRGVPRFRDPVYLAMRTRDDWMSFAKLRGEDPPQLPTVSGQNVTPIPQAPVSEIDFDKYSLLVIGIGERTGYSLSVEQVREMGNELWVQFVVLRPGKDGRAVRKCGSLGDAEERSMDLWQCNTETVSFGDTLLAVAPTASSRYDAGHDNSRVHQAPLSQPGPDLCFCVRYVAGLGHLHPPLA